ncbi:uncharacterized protein LOC133838693 isoform X1 [Drosophila sulfurigaster albostrigata]|uniref:uncharacterized protein LOC133838693 isoform X1 n=2 Tax=Drosophila sulfurigaster albostrigata TaxID=89887 RepID=UPI002D21B3E4|nr:uncharacterized protein LOC133838693 isoform X1 [Drosophila sulfurigaster albostrigata]
MFGWRFVQRKIQLTIICLLLLLCFSFMPSDANKMQKQSQTLPHNEASNIKNRIDVHRLYNAYRDRVKEVGDEAKHAGGLIAEHTAVAEEDNGDSIVPKSLKTDVGSGVKSSLIEKDLTAKRPQLITSPVASLEQVEQSQVDDLKCVPKQKPKDLEEKPVDKEHSEPDVKGMVILKMDLPSKDKSELSKNNKEEQNAAERRIAELNRVYKEFVSAWKKPNSDPKRTNFFSNKPIRLSALNELMNVVENLKQPHTMDDFVKAIDDEMNREREGLISNDKLNSKVDNIKRMSRNILAREISKDVKTGGLYEQYKTKLNEILKAPAKSLPKELSSCHCDAKKSPTLAVDSPTNTQSQCHCDASRFALAADPAKLTQCQCEEMKNSASLTGTVDGKSDKGNDYFQALEACMQLNKQKKIANGGPKPYYINNSKQRQMVWNDIPLVSKQKVAQKEPINNSDNRQTNVKTKSKCEKTNAATLNKNQKQLLHLLKVLQAKHQAVHKRGLEATGIGFPQVLVNQPAQQPPQQLGNRMIDNMAKQLNVLPLGNGSTYCLLQWFQLAVISAAKQLGQTIGYQTPNKITPEVQQQQQQPPANVAPMLEKILTRLQTMQDTNFNRGVEMWAADRLPCCFAEPADGAPCELTGSWESLLLGVRINIVDEHRVINQAPKPICAQPRVRRQCVKLTPSQIRERFKEGELKALNITIEETLPPRPHELIENISDWIFTGHAVSTLGGPISFSCRKLGSKLMGTFIGFCRNCGCIDTIFGSWTFCQSSKDCQDVTMSIFERRDVLRRYGLPEMRKERIKDHLYIRSKFGKLEKEHQAHTAHPHAAVSH